MSKGLPIIIQNFVYRRRGEGHEVLMLKRNPEKGGFWNAVNGTFEYGESIEESRKRELFEETGIGGGLKWSDELNRFSFQHGDYVVVVLCYAVEVPVEQAVVINEEHTEFKWVGFDEAIGMMKFDEDKRGLQVCRDRLAAVEI